MINVDGDTIAITLVVDQKLGFGRLPALIEMRNAPVAAIKTPARFWALLINFTAAFLIAVRTPSATRFANLVNFKQLAAQRAVIAGAAFDQGVVVHCHDRSALALPRLSKSQEPHFGATPAALVNFAEAIGQSNSCAFAFFKNRNATRIEPSAARQNAQRFFA